MMKITQKICIDLAQKRPLPRLDAVQNEAQTREIEVSLFENGAAWDIPAGTTAAVAFRKPDGTCGLYDRLPDGTDALAFSGHRVTATLAYQVLTCAGSVRVSVILYDEALNQLATFPFVLEVEENPAAGEVISNNYYNYSTLADINAAIYSASSSISRLDKRVTNLEKGILPDPFLTDDSVAYTKTVPENALPYAEITDIGGMTYKDGDTLRSAPVSAVESVGANLWNYGDYTFEQFKTVRLSRIMPAGSYSFGTLITSDNTSDSHFLVLFVTGENKSVGAGWLELNKYSSAVIVANDEFHSIRLYAGDDYSTASGHMATYTNIMFAESPTPLPYTPYVKRTLEIPEAVQALAGYGWGVSDEVYNYIDYDKKQFVKRVGKVIFDGTEPWVLDVSNVFGYKELGHLGDAKLGQCSHFTNKGLISTSYMEDKTVSLREAGYAYFKDTGVSTVDEWKGLLAKWYASGTPLTLVYVPAEPIITDISDILPADNFIEVEGGGTVTMINEYGYDVPSKITYQIKEEG